MPKTNLSKLVDKDVAEKNIVVKEESIKEEKPKKKVFEQSDGIMCRSVVSGSLYFEGAKTGMLYSFTDYGDETEIEYRDLAAAVRSKDKAVYTPRFIVVDEDFIDEFSALRKFYDDQYTIKDLKSILKMPDGDMVNAINCLPKGALENLKTLAVKQISSGEIDSVRKIKALDEAFGTNLNLLGDFVN